MSKEDLQKEFEMWQLKAALLQTQQALFHYQVKEVNENLTRIEAELDKEE